jgi:hypothetical protein
MIPDPKKNQYKEVISEAKWFDLFWLCYFKHIFLSKSKINLFLIILNTALT